MKVKILNALKTKYAHLGLTEDVFTSLSETLAPIATDETMSNLVDSQKPFLEQLQKMTDNRVTSAVEKARIKMLEDITAKQVEEKQKADELEKSQKEAETQAKKQNEQMEQMPDWFKEYNAEISAKLAEFKTAKESKEKDTKELRETLEKQKAALELIQKQNEQFVSEKKALERKNFITSKAKEVKIPDWRINEGFAISDDMDELKITEYLNTVATNLTAAILPTKSTSIPLTNGEVPKEQIDSLAKSLVGK